MGKEKTIWSVLIHLGFNMWNEEGNTSGRENNPEALASPILRCDRNLWNAYTQYLSEIGVNTLLIDIGEGLQYETHPELAVKGSWTKDEMSKELERLRGLGFEVVPKLNFSAGHDLWLGEYSRMISTSIYRKVCADLIQETCELFKPRYFHLGMDEEKWSIQKHYNYVVIRQNDVWWKDFFHLVECVEKENARAWIWSDRMWNYTDEFLENMPKSVLQSNWYYHTRFGNPLTEKEALHIKSFDLLEEHGFDQVPAGSNWNEPENMTELTKYCHEHIASERLKGFMQTPWLPFMDNERCRHALFDAADRLADAKKTWQKMSVNNK